jgi:tellurite resistance protein TerC
MLVAHWIKIPSPLALSVTVLLIGGSIVASIIARKREEQGMQS